MKSMNASRDGMVFGYHSGGWLGVPLLVVGDVAWQVTSRVLNSVEELALETQAVRVPVEAMRAE
jgi:hypothetical protein